MDKAGGDWRMVAAAWLLPILFAGLFGAAHALASRHHAPPGKCELAGVVMPHHDPSVPGSDEIARYSFANRPIGSAVPDTVSRAGTLAELVAKLGIDADRLARTVARFNAFVKSGVDDDFHRGEHQWRLAAAATAAAGGNSSLGTIELPPFYGIELQPAGGSSVGLLTDGHGRVIHQRRHPIPGLYASGVVAAATEQGVGYQAGLSLASAMTFSYLAVRHMIDRGMREQND